MYTVVCDNCGADSNEGSEFAGWNDKSWALDVVIDSDWEFVEDRHYCPNCIEI